MMRDYTQERWKRRAREVGYSDVKRAISDIYTKYDGLRRAAKVFKVATNTLRTAMSFYRIPVRRAGGTNRTKLGTGLGGLSDETLFGNSARALADKWRVSTQAVYDMRKVRRERARERKV